MIKPQDLVFLIILGVLVYKRNPKYFALAGISSIIISIPLFYKWIFFTAERLIIYAFIFLLIATVLNLINLRNNK